jgi:hypothetical protein
MERHRTSYKYNHGWHADAQALHKQGAAGKRRQGGRGGRVRFLYLLDAAVLCG